MASKKTTRKSTKKKSKSYYPVVRSAPSSAGAAANTLVDTARWLSVMNRRLYRMGRFYEVKVDLRHDWAGGPIEVFALRNDWAVHKAYQLAYKAYLENTSEERAAASSTQIARWEDFRVASGLTLPINTGLPTLHTAAGGATSLNGGEFTLSHVVNEADTQMTFSWGASSATNYGMLEEYDKSGNAQGEPSSVSVQTPYANLTDEINDQTASDLAQDNNQPPYDRDGVNTLTPWVRIAVLGSGASGVQRLSSGYFTAPCGYVLLKGFTEETEAYSVEIEAKSGDYKGVHAPSMLE